MDMPDLPETYEEEMEPEMEPEPGAHQIESTDENEENWDVHGGYENNSSGLTSDNAVNEALQNFQGRSDLLLEKYVQKVNKLLAD